MNVYLSTGEMIDQIEIGDIAYGFSEYYLPLYIKRVEQGFYKLNENKEVFEPLPMQILLGFNWQWNILPKFVSFEVALSAYNEGETIILHNGETTLHFNREQGLGHKARMSFQEFVDGKWTIQFNQK